MSLNTLDSCEINIVGTKYWSYTSPLPRPLENMRGVTLNNRVLMIGGQGSDNDRVILELVVNDESSSEWREIARMQTSRRDHAVSVVSYMKFC